MKTTLGLIVANRGFFPDKLALDGRKEMMTVLKKEGYNVVALSAKDSKYGAVETYEEAKKCAALFRKNRDKIDGVIVTHPNFGDERGVATVLKLSELNVPVLVHAFPDESGRMSIADRRDSFCGKISVCNNLVQHGIPFSLTEKHCISPRSSEFKSELEKFAMICRIVKGLRNVRIGAIGARPGAFDTVRYSEKLLENSGISTQVIDLSEIFGRIEKIKDTSARVKSGVEKIKRYVSTKGISNESLVKMAKLNLVVNDWIKENDLVGTSIQCWTSMEEYFGVVPCTIMGMMSEALLPSACEVDIGGLLGMYILQLASNKPSAILDWNNNYGNDPDKCVLFHCSNVAKSFFKSCKMDYQAIIAGSVGKENTYGTCVGKFKASNMTFLRIQTDDLNGKMSGYVGEGEFTNDKLETFGGYGVAMIKNLQGLMEFICSNGFEHHVAVNLSRVQGAVQEALTKYKGWDVHIHE